MALEVATYISDLNPTNPLGSDPLAQADDHLRLIKTTIRNTFPNINGPVTLTDEQINALETRVDALEVGGGGGGADPGGITSVATLPATGEYVGQTVYLTTDKRLYSWSGSAWVAVTQPNVAPDAPNAIEIVSSLPATATDGKVVFNTTDNKLYERINGNWVEVTLTVNAAQEVADGSITTAKFAQGIRPIEIVSALPTTNNSEGRLVYLTTDDKIYRFTGASWTSGVSTGDLVGTIGANQIAANSITAGQIAVGAIGADQIAANAINSSKIAANAITSEKIAAVAITADKIATNAITSDKISANAITAGKIAAAAIGTSQLAAGAITAASGVIANAAVGTLQIAGNAVTQAVSTSGVGTTNINTTATTVLTLSVTVSGTQPILVDVSGALLGAFNSVFNSSNCTAFGTVTLAGQTKTVIPQVTVFGGFATSASGSVLFTGVAAGTYTVTLAFTAQDTSTSAPGYGVRNPSMTILETKR